MVPYCYKALNVAKHQVRLLTLHPALNDDDSLQGGISHHSLDDHPTYEALSYTWSHDSRLKAIELDGIDFGIGPNLAAALVHIRQRNGYRRLWIDAVSVNQEDEEERSRQVQLMPRIFSAAETVIAWLGKASPDSGLAFSILETLVEKDILQMAEAKFKCSRWAALKNFWGRPFWKRIWVVQELALGRDRVIFQCGRGTIARPVLEEAFRTLQSHLNNPLTLLWEAHDCDMDWFMNQMAVCCEFDEANNNPYGHLHLEKLLDFTGHFKATDDRDHIFALLGISKDAEQARIEPDYSKSLEQVWAHTIRKLVESKQSIKVLNGNRSPRQPGQNSTLSSWMPAFGDRVRRGYGWRNGFQASGSGCQSSAEVSNCSRLLKIKGLTVDHIMCSEGPFENVQSLFEDHKVFSRMKAMAYRAFEQSQDENLRNDAQSARMEAFLKTLIANASEDTADKSGSGYGIHNLWSQLERLLRPIDSTQTVEQRMSDLAPLLRRIVITLRYRCFFTTEKGFIGVGPYDTKKGDICVVLLGGEVPFVLRSENEEQVLIGDCYVHGIMNGELSRLWGAQAESGVERYFVIH